MTVYMLVSMLDMCTVWWVAYHCTQAACPFKNTANARACVSIIIANTRCAFSSNGVFQSCCSGGVCVHRRSVSSNVRIIWLSSEIPRIYTILIMIPDLYYIHEQYVVNNLSSNKHSVHAVVI